VTIEDFNPKSAAGGSATRVAVTFAGLDKIEKEPVEGQIVVTGGAEPVARAVEITPAPQPSREWPEWIFWRSVAVFIILLVVGLVVGNTSLLNPAPGPKWSFDSWATTLTAAGGILGTVLGAATLPEVPQQIDKDSLVRLNLLFTVMVVVGPFLFQALRNPTTSASDQESGYSGWNITLLLSCATTGAAVFGELVTLGLLGWELTDGGEWGEAIKWAVVAVALIAAYYFLVTVIRLVRTDWKGPAEEAAKEAARQRYGIVLKERSGSTVTVRRLGIELVKRKKGQWLLKPTEGGEQEIPPIGGVTDESDDAPASGSRAFAPSWNLP
jgi:hypothetical protein